MFTADFNPVLLCLWKDIVLHRDPARAQLAPEQICWLKQHQHHTSWTGGCPWVWKWFKSSVVAFVVNSKPVGYFGDHFLQLLSKHQMREHLLEEWCSSYKLCSIVKLILNIYFFSVMSWGYGRVGGRERYTEIIQDMGSLDYSRGKRKALLFMCVYGCVCVCVLCVHEETLLAREPAYLQYDSAKPNLTSIDPSIDPH